MGTYSKIKGLSDVDISGKTVLLRVDFNSPIDPQAGVILDDKRFREILYTIKALDKAKPSSSLIRADLEKRILLLLSPMLTDFQNSWEKRSDLLMISLEHVPGMLSAMQKLAMLSCWKMSGSMQKRT